MSAKPGYLLDTHVLVWLDNTPQRISSSVFSLLRDPESSIYVSSASIWEAAIKISLKKLGFDTPIPELMRSAGFQELAVTSRYTDVVERLPFHHKDPFDRMLIAQAQVESLILITSDPLMLPYDVPIISV